MKFEFKVFAIVMAILVSCAFCSFAAMMLILKLAEVLF